MVAGADLVVDAVARARDALAARELAGVLGAHAALAGQLAFAVGDDDFQAALGGLHRLLQRRHHLGDAVGAHGAQPFHAHHAQRLLDVDAGRRAVAAGGARRDVLLAGGRGVAVLHHDQHAVAFVEQIGGDAGDQPVMPEAAVAHDGDRALLHVGPDRGGAGERHAIAEDGIAHRERREGRERMAADVGRDVRRAELALHQLERREHRPLRAAGAEGGRARRQRAERGGGFRLVRDEPARLLRDGFGVEAVRPRRLQEGGEALQQHFRRIFAGLRQRPLAEHLGLDVGAAQLDVDRLLDVVGVAFLDDQDRALAGAEFADLFRHQRIDHVEHQHAARARRRTRRRAPCARARATRCWSARP